MDERDLEEMFVSRIAASQKAFVVKNRTCIAVKELIDRAPGAELALRPPGPLRGSCYVKEHAIVQHLDYRGLFSTALIVNGH